MTADKIKNRLSECATLFGFEYNNKEGNVDPCFIPESNSYEFLLFYDGQEQTVYSAEDAVNTPFIDGKSIAEIADKIIIDEW